MGWFSKTQQTEEAGQERAIIYLPPEALQYVYVMPAEEFENFQNSPEFVPGGQLMEVCRQYGYSLRKVADLRDETITFRQADRGASDNSAAFAAQTAEPISASSDAAGLELELV